MADKTEESPNSSNWDEVLNTFDDMNLKPELIRGIYTYGFEVPSLIQQKAIKPIIIGRNTIAQAPPRTGRTSAFTVGILEILDSSLSECQALVLSCIPEVAQHTSSIANHLGSFLRINSCALNHGTVREDIRVLEEGCQVVIGTPEQVLYMISLNYLSVKNLKIFVLDDVDELLSSGFISQIYKILNYLPGNVQYCLFSAMIPPELFELTNEFIKDPVRILWEGDVMGSERINQYYITVEQEDCRFAALIDLYKKLDIASAIIFANTKSEIEILTKRMLIKDFLVSSIYFDMEQTRMELSINEFRMGLTRVLITDDYFAKRLCFDNGVVVVNYGMPEDYGNYFDRIFNSYAFGARNALVINLVTESDLQFLDGLKQHYNAVIKEIPEDLRIIYPS